MFSFPGSVRMPCEHVPYRKNARTPEEKKVERRGQLAGSTVHEHDLLARKHTELARPRPPHVHFVPEPLGGAPPHLNNKERRFREPSFVLSVCCGKKNVKRRRIVSIFAAWKRIRAVVRQASKLDGGCRRSRNGSWSLPFFEMQGIWCLAEWFSFSFFAEQQKKGVSRTSLWRMSLHLRQPF